MRKITNIGSVLLLSVLFLTIPSISTTTVNAYEGGTAVFCPNCYIPPPDGPDTSYEIWLSYQTCDSIHDMLSDYGDNDLNYFLYNSSVHYYTWGSWIYSLTANTDHAAIFSKGHCVPWGEDNYPPEGGDHFKLLEYAENWEYAKGAEDSNHILPYTAGNENYFVFIWHCASAQSYPSWSDINGSVGMPYAFTRNNDMDYYGSSGDYIYLGWSWQSPQFESTITWQYPYYGWAYAHLLFDYLCEGYSIAASLDYVSYQIGSVPFYYSSEYGELVGWGNGALGLPD